MVDQGLLGTLYDRRDKIALKSLVVRKCRVYDSRYEEWVRELVEEVTWDDVMVDIPDDDSEAENRDDYSEAESRDESEDESEFMWHLY